MDEWIEGETTVKTELFCGFRIFSFFVFLFPFIPLPSFKINDNITQETSHERVHCTGSLQSLVELARCTCPHVGEDMCTERDILCTPWGLVWFGLSPNTIEHDLG